MALGSSISRFFVDSEAAPPENESAAVYMPQLALNQYVHKEDKLADVKRFVVKGSRTEMILL